MISRNLTVRYQIVACIAWLLVLFLFTGCLPESRRLSETARLDLKSLRVVAVEPPPLEVIPDLLERRMPVYRHYQNMVLQLCPEEALYRSPGGILIAGKIGQGDSVQKVSYSMTKDKGNEGQRPHLKVSAEEVWVPTLALSTQLVSQLRAKHVRALPGHYVLSLPLALNERGADLVRWRAAVERWYGLETTGVDYRQLADAPVDAVLEIGIGHYRIFEGQLLLQILLKLVDADSGQTIARTSQTSRSLETSSEGLLLNDAEAFKGKIQEMGMELMGRGLQEIGLAPEPSPAPFLPIPS